MIRNYIKTAFLLIFFFLTVMQPLAAANSNDDSHDINAADVLAEIRIEQNVNDIKEIRADKVSSRLLEKLGDAVMSERFPDSEEHEYMDEMMGGEGSQNLKMMHERIGYFYIKNGFNSRGRFWGASMMGPGMMTSQGYGFLSESGTDDRFPGPFRGHMGYGFYGYGWIINTVILVLLAAGVVIIMKKFSGNRKDESALDILKKRYARGEISKKEYETLKREIQ